ncbi:transposase [Micromonospora chalcea]|uniref:transposase n=1 Tax=Micromonospora chalcea TaxID=1874 RepID=UPI00381F3E30
MVAEHELGEIVTSLPGIGTTLAAEFLAHAGTLTTYQSPAALAAHAGLAPISRDSGRRQGHQVRPHRYHRGLRRVFSMSSFTALTHCPRSRAYYDKKRAEGKHTARPPQPCPDNASTSSGLHPRQDPLPAQTTKISRGGAVLTRVETPGTRPARVASRWVGAGRRPAPRRRPATAIAAGPRGRAHLGGRGRRGASRRRRGTRVGERGGQGVDRGHDWAGGGSVSRRCPVVRVHRLAERADAPVVWCRGEWFVPGVAPERP